MADERECFRADGRSYQVYHLFHDGKSEAEKMNVALCGKRAELGLVECSHWGEVESHMRCCRCLQIDERARAKGVVPDA